MANEILDELRQHLSALPVGPVEDVGEIPSLLAAAWGVLDDSRSGGMVGSKLLGRMESVEWHPPLLSFEIERHGGAANGSVYAEGQRWTVDVAAGSAHFGEAGRRLLRPKRPPLDVAPLAQELVSLVTSAKDGPALRWRGRSRVTVRVGVLVPSDSAVAQTVAGIRRRLMARIAEDLAAAGWQRVDGTSPHTFETPAQ